MNFFDFLIKNRKIIIILVIALTLFMAYSTLNVKLNTDFSTYLSDDDQIVKEFKRVGDVFGSNYLGMAIVQKEEIFTLENLQEIKRLADNYREIDGVLRVMSIADAVDSNNANQEIIENEAFPANAEELKEYQNYIFEQEFFKGNFINEAGTASVILITFDPEANHIQVANNIDKVTSKISSTPENVYFGGMPFMMSAFQTTIVSNLIYLLPIMLLLLLGVLYIGFRSLAGMIFPLIIVLISSIWLVAILSLFGIPLDILSGIVPIILVAMGSADAIHILRRFYELRNENHPVSEAIKGSMQEMSSPIILTTITTMIGFASLATSNFAVISQFGLVTTLGVFLALLATFILLPPMLSLTKNKVISNNEKELGNVKILNKLGDIIFYRRKTMIFLTLIVTLVALLGIPKIVSNVDWSLCFSKGSKPYQAEMLLRDQFSGSLFAQISVKGSVNDPTTLEVMKRVGKYINTLPQISQASSLADVFSEANYRVSGNYSIPENSEMYKQIWELLKNDDLLKGIADIEKEEFLITGKVGTMSTVDMSYSVDAINEFIEENNGKWVMINLNNNLADVDKEILQAKQLDYAVQNLLWDLQTSEYQVNEKELKEIVKKSVEDKDLNREKKLQKAFTELSKMVDLDLQKDQLLVKKIMGSLWDAQSTSVVINKRDFDKLNLSVQPEAETKITLTQAGMVTVLKQMEEELTPTQIKSVFLALGIVLLILSLIFRSIIIGLIGISPIILTIIVNFGVIGYLRIGLDSFTAMIASISIGLGVDYAIHFTSRFKKEAESNDNILTALKNTLQSTGVAVILNTLSVGLGFTVLLFAAGQHLQRFGGLLALALVVSAIFTLTVLPTLTLLFKPKYLKNTKF